MKTSFLLLSALTMLPVSIFAQGSLTPPAAPAPTMKTLDQVEARTIINATNTPGSGNSLFIISSPGSYYLTGNVTGVSGKDGIEIHASNVTIDLNGFSLTGVSGSQFGISDRFGINSPKNVTIRNGTILAWGGSGIDLSVASGSLFEDLIVYANGDAGMKTGDACVLRDCVSRSNTGTGIVTGSFANLIHCSSMFGGGDGINLQGVATDCEAYGNVQYGIEAGNNSLVSHCSASANNVGGISVGQGSTIAGCAASGNGGGSGTGFGIFTGNACSVTDSTASYNTVAFGIAANPGSTVTNCAASFNTSAQSTSGGIVTFGSTVIGCTARSNTTTIGVTHTTGMGIYVNGSNATIKNCTVSENNGDGINVPRNCIVADNQCNNNGVDGIFCTGGSGANNRVDSNHACNNTGIGIHAGADWVVRNTAFSNTGGNFSVGSSTDEGPIDFASTATSPWANLQ